MNWLLAEGLEYVLLLGGFVLSAFLCYLIRSMAPSLKLVEKPREDRLSDRLVPMGGGLAWVTAFLLVVMVGAWWVMVAELPQSLKIHKDGLISKSLIFTWICGGGATLMLMGLWDDIRPVPIYVKLIVQFAIAITLSFQVPDVIITAFVDDITVNRIFTVCWIVAFINSFNLLDHADGISASTAMAVFFSLACMSAISGQLFVGLLSFLLFGVLAGFLFHNFPPAKMFMGDAGSLPLGYFVGVITALFTFYTDNREITSVFMPLSLLLVPIYDTASVCLIRFREKKPLWVGDKNHLSHRLLEKGVSPRKIVIIVFALTLCGGLMSTSLMLFEAPWTYVALAMLVLLVFVIQKMEQYR